MAERVEALAAGLLSLGVAAEDRIGIASATRLEWILADLAILCAGAATTTVYPSTNAEDTAYILADSELADRLRRGRQTAGKAQGATQRLTQPRAKVVVFDGAADGDWVITLDDLTAPGREVSGRAPLLRAHVAEEITPDQLATLIYTSGTTGSPKGCGCATRRGCTPAP